MIDQRALLNFKTLAETLHFGKTSEKCHTTSSALTRLIQRMEIELDVVLFERNNRTVKLTDAGKIYYKFAIETLQQWEDLHHKLHPTDKNIEGNIRLFCTVTASYVVLPKIIRELHNQYKKIKIHLETGSTHKGIDLLEKNKADAVISILDKHIPEAICSKIILSTPMVFVIPKENKIKTLKAALNELEFIMPSQFIQNKVVANWFKNNAFHPSIHSEVDGNEAILSMVSAGLGMSILPNAVITHSHLSKNVQILKIQASLPIINVGLLMRKNSLKSPVKQKFWETCEQLKSIEA